MERRIAWSEDLYGEETYIERGLTQRYIQRWKI